MNQYSYQGSELDLFRRAVNWKRYCAAMLRPFIAGDVLDVGAGIGNSGQVLSAHAITSWTALEPDRTLLARLRAAMEAEPASVPTKALLGTVQALPVSETFDTILYLDVLEHIAHDRAELAASATRLRPGGHLIVLAPAHNWLRSPFDDSVGHHRRYTRRSLAQAAPETLCPVTLFYLDSLGVLASAANRLVLRTSHPTLSQIRFWDALLVPGSRVLDRLFRHAVGKSVVGVWQRPAQGVS